MAKSLSVNMAQRITGMYRVRKMTAPEIAKEIGRPKPWVVKAIAELERARAANIYGKPIAANNARNKKIIKLYKEGLTAEQIAVDLGGLTPSGVLYTLRSRGVKLRKPGDWSPPRPKEYYRIRAYARKIAPMLGTGPGTSAAVFATKAGIPKERLRAHLRALGVKNNHHMGSARITLDDATAIKRLVVTTDRSLSDIGREFGINSRTVSSIAVGHTWTHAPWPNGKVYVRRRKESSIRKALATQAKNKGKSRRR